MLCAKQASTRTPAHHGDFLERHGSGLDFLGGWGWGWQKGVRFAYWRACVTRHGTRLLACTPPSHQHMQNMQNTYREVKKIVDEGHEGARSCQQSLDVSPLFPV